MKRNNVTNSKNGTAFKMIKFMLLPEFKIKKISPLKLFKILKHNNLTINLKEISRERMTMQ